MLVFSPFFIKEIENMIFCKKIIISLFRYFNLAKVCPLTIFDFRQIVPHETSANLSFAKVCTKVFESFFLEEKFLGNLVFVN